jgi:hypothetical protein
MFKNFFIKERYDLIRDNLIRDKEKKYFKSNQNFIYKLIKYDRDFSIIDKLVSEIQAKAQAAKAQAAKAQEAKAQAAKAEAQKDLFGEKKTIIFKHGTKINKNTFDNYLKEKDAYFTLTYKNNNEDIGFSITVSKDPENKHSGEDLIRIYIRIETDVFIMYIIKMYIGTIDCQESVNHMFNNDMFKDLTLTTFSNKLILKFDEIVFVHGTYENDDWTFTDNKITFEGLTWKQSVKKGGSKKIRTC